MSRKAASNPAIKTYRRTLKRSFKKSRKRVVRYGLLFANILLLLAVVGFVAQSPDSGQGIRQNAVVGDGVDAANPLDQLSSSDIAVHLAQMASLPESTAVVNQADTITGQMAVSEADTNVVAKPQIVATSTKSNRDIQKYVTVAGDTYATVAAKFGVTSDSIRWSNDLTGNNLPINRELYIPPVNGIVYLVKAGDTVDKLAGEFGASRDAIIAFNDAEVSGLVVGKRIVIPDGTKGTGGRSVASVLRNAGGAWGNEPIFGGNGYDRGWCTFWAAKRAAQLGMPVPSNWGNANTWDNYAARQGWTVNAAPRVGAVAQSDAGGLGHVGVVEEVSADGSMIRYSDMNGLCGWGCSQTSGWVPTTSKFKKFIYR